MTRIRNIQSRWFTDELGSGNPRKRNDFFLYQLDQVRAFYHLDSSGKGVDTSTKSIPVVAREQLVYINLRELRWLELYQDELGYMQPQFSLSIRMYVANQQARTVANSKLSEVLHLPFIIKFTAHYPMETPNVYWDRAKTERNYRIKRSFHWRWPDDRLCILNAPEDWIIGVSSNMLTCINATVDWMAANSFLSHPPSRE